MESNFRATSYKPEPVEEISKSKPMLKTALQKLREAILWRTFRRRIRPESCVLHLVNHTVQGMQLWEISIHPPSLQQFHHLNAFCAFAGWLFYSLWRRCFDLLASQIDSSASLNVVVDPAGTLRSKSSPIPDTFLTSLFHFSTQLCRPWIFFFPFHTLSRGHLASPLHAVPINYEGDEGPSRTEGAVVVGAESGRGKQWRDRLRVGGGWGCEGLGRGGASPELHIQRSHWTNWFNALMQLRWLRSVSSRPCRRERRVTDRIRPWKSPLRQEMGSRLHLCLPVLCGFWDKEQVGCDNAGAWPTGMINAWGNLRLFVIMERVWRKGNKACVGNTPVRRTFLMNLWAEPLRHLKKKHKPLKDIWCS